MVFNWLDSSFQRFGVLVSGWDVSVLVSNYQMLVLSWKCVGLNGDGLSVKSTVAHTFTTTKSFCLNTLTPIAFLVFNKVTLSPPSHILLVQFCWHSCPGEVFLHLLLLAIGSVCLLLSLFCTPSQECCPNRVDFDFSREWNVNAFPITSRTK